MTANTNMNIIRREYSQIYLNIRIFATLWSIFVAKSPISIRLTQVKPSETKWAQVNPNEPKWTQVNPIISNHIKSYQIISNHIKSNQIILNHIKSYREYYLLEVDIKNWSYLVRLTKNSWIIWGWWLRWVICLMTLFIL